MIVAALDPRASLPAPGRRFRPLGALAARTAPALLCLWMASALAGGGVPRREAQAATPKATQALGLPRRDDAAARAEAMERRRGGKPSAEYLRGKNAILEAEARKWLGTRPLAPSAGTSAFSSSGTWMNIGPGTLDSGSYSPFAQDTNSGRPTAILTHPTDPRILYVASCGGGVWKCSNADLKATGDWTWTSITDSLPVGGAEGSVPVGDLAMDPDDPNLLYLGLGDHLNAGNAIGFWISKDAGATWTRGWTNAPGPDNQTAKILPLGGGRILVATSGWVNSGLFLSTNGGFTFNRTGASTPGSSFLANALVAFSPTDLALAGYINQYPEVPLKWMYSSDGGSTWNDSTLDASMTALPLDPYAANLACARTGDGIGYGVVGVKGTGFLAKGVVRTSNKGRSWTFLPSSEAFSMNGDGGQAAYNPYVTVDPEDSNHVFIGANYGSYRSLDGGQHWSRMTAMVANMGVVYSHADFHVATWAQAGTKTLFVGNDGGLSIFRDPLRATIPGGGGQETSDVTFVDNRRNKGMINHMAYSVASTTATNVPGARNFVLAGMQDNSTGMRLSAGTEFYLSPSTGDGMGVLIHPTDATKALASSYSNWIYFCTNFGTASPTWTRSEGITSPNTLFFTPTLPLPTHPQGVLTTTADVVYTSQDFGQHFSALPMTGVASTFHISRPAASYLSAGTYAISGWSSADLTLTGYVTQNGGTSWTRFGQVSPIRGTNLWDIAFSPLDPNVLYATTQTYNLTGSHLFKSINLGATWTSIDGSATAGNGYPFGIPANVVRASQSQPSVLYVGTDLGVYVSENAGTTWTRLGTGLPYVRVEDLYEAPDGSFLRVATYGRGIWELPLSAQAPAILTQPASVSLKAGERATFTVTATGAAPLSYQWQVSIDGGGVWATIAGETSSTYQTPILQLSDHGKKYRVQASNGMGTATSNPATLTVAAAAKGDFNGDGKADLLWRNAVTGQVYLMPLDGTTVLPGTIIHTEPRPEWQIVATADFDGDGRADILWWNSQTGQLYQMLMNGSTIKAQALIYTEPNTAWTIQGSGDFNGDGKADILWRNATTGQVYLMPMNGATVQPGTIIHTEPNPAWQIVAVADFDGDGTADLLWWNNSTGQVYQMLMNGGTIKAQGLVHTEPNTAWRIIGTGDFNGDGRADILWRNSSTGAIYLMPMNGALAQPGTIIHTEPNPAWQIVSLADFDGDGKYDILWWNNQSGQIYQMLMNGSAIKAQGLIYTEPNTAWKIQAGGTH